MKAKRCGRSNTLTSQARLPDRSKQSVMRGGTNRAVGRGGLGLKTRGAGRSFFESPGRWWHTYEERVELCPKCTEIHKTSATKLVFSWAFVFERRSRAIFREFSVILAAPACIFIGFGPLWHACCRGDAGRGEGRVVVLKVGARAGRPVATAPHHCYLVLP